MKITANGQIIKEDPFFEILDLGDYILLPLNMLAEHLPIQVFYEREQNLLSVKSAKEEVQIDLERKEYLKHLEWSKEEPEIVNGDFFVSPKVLEFLLDIAIEWDRRYQELVIEAAQLEPKEEKGDMREIKKVSSAEDEVQEEEIIEGPAFSLGSIQYQLQLEGRQAGEEKRLKGRETIYLHGRAKNWAFSLGESLEHDFEQGQDSIDLLLIRGKYQDDKRLIILGDSEIDLDRTIGQNKIRGVLVQLPSTRSNQLLAYTSIAGLAEAGDQVSVYLNGRLYRQQQVLESGPYLFERIILKNKALNTIKVVVKKPNGEEYEASQEIMASPRLYPLGSNELTIAAGNYKAADEEEWQGRMLGLDHHRSLGANLSLDWEALLREDNGSVPLLGSDLGVSFRPVAPLVLSLDWLMGGEKEKLQSGIQAEALYGFPAGFLEAAYLYLPLETARGVEQEAEEKKELTGLWELDEQRSIILEGTDKKSLVEGDVLQEASLTFEKKKDWEDYYALTGSLSHSEELKKYYNVHTDKAGLIFQARSMEDYLYQMFKLGLFKGYAYVPEVKEGFKLRELNISGEAAKILNNYLLLTGEVELDHYWQEEDYVEGNIQFLGSARWSYQDTSLVLSGETQGTKNQATAYHWQNQTAKLSFLLRHYLDHRRDLYLDLGYYRNNYDASYDYHSLEIGSNLYLGKDRLNLNLGYISPVKNREEAQWKGGLAWEKDFQNGLGLKIELEKLYDTVWATEPEYVLRITLEQILALAGGIIQGQPFSKGEHISFVGGLVYLDENGNQKYDPGERTLAGIKMALGGRRVESNEEGIFRFDYVPPDIYRLGFDLNSLSADYSPVTEEKLIKIKENENMFLEFGLTINGSISGTVFHDQNANGSFDAGEKAIPLVGFSLNGNKRAYTDRRGNFYFDNLPLGEYTLTLMEESLPDILVPATAKEIKIKITEAELDHKGILIPLVYQFVN